MANLKTVAENTNQRTVSAISDEDEELRHTIMDDEFPYAFPIIFSRESNLRTVQEI